MTIDDEKDPPVPADLEGAPKRVHRERVAEERGPDDHGALADEPTE